MRFKIVPGAEQMLNLGTAKKLLEQAESSLREGNWKAFGEKMNRLKQQRARWLCTRCQSRRRS